MNKNAESGGPPQDVIARVLQAFLIYEADELLEPLTELLSGSQAWTPLVLDAADGLRSVVSASSLPFHLIQDAVSQRRFDRMLSAERIRSLKEVAPGDEPSKELEARSFERVNERMRAFLDSQDGRDYMRDGIVYELDRSLRSTVVSAAAVELLIQTLVSTWAVFETFARSFIVAWINADPRRARPVLASTDLKTYFGKQAIDIEVIGNHGFDLTGSMGSVLFRGRRLDSLATVRSATGALFNDPALRIALGDDLWMLNQRRHLFVHRRGMVDEEYLQRTGDKVAVGQRLTISSKDVERYLLAVQEAVIAMSKAAEKHAAAS